MPFFVLFALSLFVSACADDAGGEKIHCAEPCEGERPYCDTRLGLCVRCRDDADCDGVCVGVGLAAECRECATEADCGGDHCIEGQCFECTLATEALDCGETSCDHREAPFACTDTRRGSLGLLDVCRVDSECWTDLGYACVQTYFQGEPEETRCLKRVSAGCQRPTMSSRRRASVSSEESDDYCVFVESRASGAAVRAMMAGRPCELEADAEETCGPGGLCRFLEGAGEYRCTIPCESDSECFGAETQHCSRERFCGSGQ